MKRTVTFLAAAAILVSLSGVAGAAGRRDFHRDSRAEPGKVVQNDVLGTVAMEPGTLWAKPSTTAGGDALVDTRGLVVLNQGLERNGQVLVDKVTELPEGFGLHGNVVPLSDLNQKDLSVAEKLTDEPIFKEEFRGLQSMSDVPAEVWDRKLSLVDKITTDPIMKRPAMQRIRPGLPR